MTTTEVLTPPAPRTDQAPKERNGFLFGRAYRATGYCRLGIGPLASGPDHSAGLTLPIEQVVAVDARTRPGGRLSVSVVGPAHLEGAAIAAAEYLGALGHLSGDVRLTVRPPVGVHTGGLDEATAAATIDALSKAEELGLTPPARARMVAACLPKVNTLGLAHGAMVIADHAGTAVHTCDDPARLMLLIAVHTAAPTTPAAPFGQLVAAPEPGADAATAAGWVLTCSGAGTSAARGALAEVIADCPAALGVAGGYSELSPVVGILSGGSAQITTAQRLATTATARLNALTVDGAGTGHWIVTVSQSAAPSAAS